MLDLGCGLADGTVTFASDDRMLVGVDYDQPTAAQAIRLHPSIDLTTVCSDAKLPIRTGNSFDDVCSSHLIEHFFVEPEYHVAEVARVLDDEEALFLLDTQ